MIRVLLADDQSLVRAGFKALLDAQPDIEVAGEAADGEEAVRKVRGGRRPCPATSVTGTSPVRSQSIAELA